MHMGLILICRRTHAQDMEMVHKLKTREDAVMHLLRNDRAPYDRYHALVLVQVTDFKLGQYFLYVGIAI